MPAFRRRRTALPMRAIERAVALEHPVNRRARGSCSSELSSCSAKPIASGPYWPRTLSSRNIQTHAQNARFDIHAYVGPRRDRAYGHQSSPGQDAGPVRALPNRPARTAPLHCHGAHASPVRTAANHLVTTFRNRTFLAMAHLSKMPLGYGQETGAPTISSPSVWKSPLPGPTASTAAKFGTCRMIHPGLWIWSGWPGPARALRPCGQPMDNIRVAHRLHTLGPLAHKLHRLNNKITERMMH